MKTITKLRLAVILFMAIAVFNNAMAQKFELKTVEYAHLHPNNGEYKIISDGKENSSFLLNFDKKELTIKETKFFPKGTYPIDNIKFESGEYDDGVRYKRYFFDCGNARKNILEMSDDSKNRALLVMQLVNASIFTGDNITFEGKVTEFNK